MRSATTTLAAYSALVIALPAADVVLDVLPAPGRYAGLARAVAVLLSALLAVREIRHDYGVERSEAKDVRRSGAEFLVPGVLLLFAYLAVHDHDLGVLSDVVTFVLYVAMAALLSWAFVRLAKKAYDFAEEYRREQELPQRLRERTELLKKEADRLSGRTSPLPQPTSDPAPRPTGRLQETRVAAFCGVFFAALAAAVAALSAATSIFGLLPPIIEHDLVAAALSAMLATFVIGSNYTSQFLERNLALSLSATVTRLERTLARKNVVEAGLVPVLAGVGCLVAFLVLDSVIGGAPPESVGLEIALVALRMLIFTLITYGIWRLGVASYTVRAQRR